jgi:hypothetical protein
MGRKAWNEEKKWAKTRNLCKLLVFINKKCTSNKGNGEIAQ